MEARHHHSESPARAKTTVLLYLPGTMRSVYDQSIDLLAARLAQAFSLVTGLRFLPDRNATNLVLDPGTELRLRTITCTDDANRTLVLIEADYGPMLTASFGESGIVIQFMKLFALLGRMCPRVVLLLAKSVPEPHTKLSYGQKVLVMSAFVVGVAVLLSIGVAAFQIVAALVATMGDSLKDTGPVVSLKDWIADLQGYLGRYSWLVAVASGLSVLVIVFSVGGAVLAVLWSLVPSKVPESIIALGKEYSGVVRYILKDERRKEIESYVAAVRDCVAERYSDAEVHMLCFSFGCVVGFNHLFPKPDWKSQAGGAPRTVTFLGFPFVVIEAAFPGYLRGRVRSASASFHWKNVFLGNDVLGSRLKIHLADIFREGQLPDVDDRKVKPQKSSSLNFVTDHMAYWDPDSKECAEAFLEVAQSIEAC
jgi:hypothetical protein